MARFQKVKAEEVFAVQVEMDGTFEDGTTISAGDYLVIQGGVATFMSPEDFEAEGLKPVRNGGSQAPHGETRGKVLELVNEGVTGASEIAKRLNTTYGNVRSHLRRLWNDGLVGKEGDAWVPKTTPEPEV